MPKIKWIGIVSDLSKYQLGSLPPAAKKLDMPASVSEMMLKGLPFAVPSVLIVSLSMFIKTFLSRQAVVSPVFVALGFIIGFALLLVHELLHAAVYPKRSEVYIGVYPKAFAAIALASYPLSRARFIVMSLLPYILGVVPIVLFWVMPADTAELNGLFFGASVMGLVSPYTDLYNVYQVLRQTPKRCVIQFYGDDVYWF